MHPHRRASDKLGSTLFVYYLREGAGGVVRRTVALALGRPKFDVSTETQEGMVCLPCGQGLDYEEPYLALRPTFLSYWVHCVSASMSHIVWMMYSPISASEGGGEGVGEHYEVPESEIHQLIIVYTSKHERTFVARCSRGIRGGSGAGGKTCLIPQQSYT